MNEHDHTPHNVDELEDTIHAHDEWFRHSPDEPHHQAAHGDFNPIVVGGFLVATVVITFGVALIVVPWFTRVVNAERARVQEQNTAYAAEYREKVDRWTTDLSKPEWIDAENNVVRIPVDVAIEEVMERYGARR